MSDSRPYFVYRCFDADGRLIYVGCTFDPAGRISTHRTTSWWGHQVEAVRVLVFPSKEYALAKEREAIATENPRWNTKGRWAHRALWTGDDYADYYACFTMAGNAGTSYNKQHLVRVVREAKQRYGLRLTEDVAS